MRLTTRSLLLCSSLCARVSAHWAAESDSKQQPIAYLQGPLRDDDDKTPAYRAPLLSFHRALVDVPSVSGSEGSVASLLEKILTHYDYTVELQRLPATNPSTDSDHENHERYNVLAWPGRNADRTLHNRVLVTSHIDVVPPYIPYSINGTPVAPGRPYDFSNVTSDTLISGRGSVDAKGSVAAQITATSLLLDSGAIPASDVVLLFVVGEETSGQGMKFFSSSLSNRTLHPGGGRPQFRAAIFGEPTENKLACGHKGILGGSISAQGKAGHSGYPWLGKSAIAVLVRALDQLLSADLGSSERYGNTTVNVGFIEGGVAANVIAKEARARLAVRIAVGNQTTGGEIVAEGIRKVLSETDEEALGLELVAGYGPVECNCDVEGE
jgi:acetylornithine deacetylase/succinyl-diaminopimelate desuccinylase-like protein